MTDAATTPSVDWTALLRAMAEEIDATGGAGARDSLLRAVGQRMAAIRPLTPAPTMDRLAMEVNDMLATIGWGHVSFQLNERDRSLLISHSNLPRAGAAGDPPGTWLSAVLEGLYGGWMGQLGSDPALQVRRMRVSPTMVLLRYSRA
jgi:hypothetical protein